MKIQIQYSCFHIFTKITEIDMCQIISLSFSLFFWGGGCRCVCLQFAWFCIMCFIAKKKREREGTKKKINRERKGGREKKMNREREGRKKKN